MPITPKPVNCSNPDHKRPVPAIVRLYWPMGHHEPSAACRLDLTFQLRAAIEEGAALEVWPVASIPDNPMALGVWRRAPDCDRCKDAGRFQENGVDAHCGCKRGRRMAELWRAAKDGYTHPDEPEPEPSWDDPPF